MEITFGKLVGTGYSIAAIVTAGVGAVLGFLFVFSSVLSGVGIWVASALMLVAGALAFPTTRSVLDDSANITISGGAAGVIVGGLSAAAAVVFFVALVVGLLAAGGGDADTGSTPIQQSSDAMLPTIDDFDSGWAVDERTDTSARFFNAETESTVSFNVSVHDSADAAASEFAARRPEDVATDAVDAGDEGYLYQLGEGYYIIEIRVQNVVGRVQFISGPAVLTPESNAKDFAQLFADSIVG